MEWSIQELARLAGTTSRTLRHYGERGLLTPSRVGANGYRYYDRDALLRLQRILLLRDLGLGLAEIGRVLAHDVDQAEALDTHLELLRQQQARLARQVAAVERTVRTVREGGDLMAEHALDGFDHTEHREEVERRWGRQAYADGDRWWRGLGADGQAQWKARAAALAESWREAAASGVDPGSHRAQELAGRHVDWLAGVPGTPACGGRPDPAYVRGLGELYVADERFSAQYGGVVGAGFVRDALARWADVQEGAEA